MKIKKEPKIIFMIGVSGSGKSLVGYSLANDLDLPFIEADDFHPDSNIEKMTNGIPLNDDDRLPWLDRLHQMAIDHKNSGCVIACSALKKIYRDRLADSIEDHVIWIYLKGDYDLIFSRMQNRKDHFMRSDMLKSQFEALEEPQNALEIDIADHAEIIVEKIKGLLE